MSQSRRRFPFALVGVMVVAWASLAPAQGRPAPTSTTNPHLARPPVRLMHGLVVVASQHAPIRETWSLASRVYRDPTLRPRHIDDATARALAGEAPSRRTAGRSSALFDLRSKIAADGPSTRRMLSTIAADLGVSGVVLVYKTKAGQPRARLFVASRHDFEPPVLWPQPGPHGRSSWAPSVTWLSSLARRSRSEQDETQDRGRSILSSAWFWGALAAAAGVVVIGLAVSRDDEPATIHLQGRVQP